MKAWEKAVQELGTYHLGDKCGVVCQLILKFLRNRIFSSYITDLHLIAITLS